MFNEHCSLMNLINSYSDSCGISIEEDDSVLLTGGSDGGDEVSSVIKYNLTGMVANFPDLHEARYFHACASYVNEDNLRVKNLLMNEHCYFMQTVNKSRDAIAFYHENLF